MMPLPPTVRLLMLPSNRIVWASKPPSMNTLLTPGDVPKSKPRTNLWLNHCALLDLPTKNSGILRLALPIKVATSPARFAGRRTGTIGLSVFSACPSVDRHRCDLHNHRTKAA
jgi:hypothetical protein